jgi:hypothetical protein
MNKIVTHVRINNGPKRVNRMRHRILKLKGFCSMRRVLRCDMSRTNRTTIPTIQAPIAPARNLTVRILRPFYIEAIGRLHDHPSLRSSSLFDRLRRLSLVTLQSELSPTACSRIHSVPRILGGYSSTKSTKWPPESSRWRVEFGGYRSKLAFSPVGYL